ncbi:hypothetical protein [Fibrivirga algicola]|uniref:Outer membrane protein beta-barrel domain-containing protein n=1 Tax=Fibrivirga algicola TaxID=2950420 RepID=A0ABX0QMU2_9BACT|nr:hypothetical protein [Fibrivirga algicola]NID13441.1 hypothetical protein [Fibrivirga algicola]
MQRLWLRVVYCWLLLGLPFVATAQLKKAYGKPTRWAVTAELGGFGPFASLNAEYAPLQTKTSFFVLRGGVGHTFSRSLLCSLPASVSWNLVLNGQTRGCPPTRLRNPTLLEVGMGGVYPLYTDKELGSAYRWSPLLGVRHYFPYNSRATGFWKVQLTPLVTGQLSPWVGLSAGVVID